MANNEPKKGGILRAYLNFNVLYKILIGLPHDRGLPGGGRVLRLSR